MVTREIESAGHRPRVVLALTLAVVAGFALWFVGHKIVAYSSYNAVAYDDLWPRKLGFLPHMAGGIVAILTGVTQIWLGLTDRTAKLHHVLGRFYVGGVIVGAAGGLYLAVTVQDGGFAYAGGLFTLAIAWLITTFMAIVAVHRRALEQHREWMIRSYIVTFAFVTFRFFDYILSGLNVAPPDQIASFLAFACWAVPLLLAEPLIQLRKMRAR
jgi:uncharacterized membrane protein